MVDEVRGDDGFYDVCIHCTMVTRVMTFIFNSSENTSRDM
jgi:hypothetical protein